MSRDFDSDAPAGAAGSGRESDRRRQQAGFSVFLDHVVDPQGRQRAETRLYHAESGVETTLDGAFPEQWIAWIVERIRQGEIAKADQRRGPEPTTAELLSVEILEVTVGKEPAGRNATLHKVRALVVVQLVGVDRFEREIGSHVLRGIASHLAVGEIPPTVS